MWMLVAAVLLLLVLAGVIGYPLFMTRLEPYALPDLPDESFSERDALLEALSDLEESYHAGKVSETDYSAQKQRLELQYIEVTEGGASDA
ncbi:MAG TPA: hypothetical protein VKB51_12070 [bacterium]|nr:hypothetical protein [bacterium]